MLKSALSTLLLAALSISAAQAADTIGFKEIELPHASGDRPLRFSIWYPTIDVGPVVRVGENRVFYGVTSIKDARPVGNALPLVVLIPWVWRQLAKPELACGGTRASWICRCSARSPWNDNF